MSHKRMPFELWVKRAAATYGKPEFYKLNGPSPGGAAAALGFSRQRVYQLGHEGRLDILTVFDHDGSTRFVMVTHESLQAELARRQAKA